MQSENIYSCEQGFPTLREDIHILDITWDTKIHRDIPSLFHVLEKIPLCVKVRYFGYPIWRDIFPFLNQELKLYWIVIFRWEICQYIFSWYLRILRDNKISLWSIVRAIFGHKMGKYSRVSPESDPWIQGCYREIISVSEQEKSLVWYFINTNSKTIMWTCKQCVLLSIPTRAKLRGFLHPLSCPIHCHWSCYIVSLDISPLKGRHEEADAHAMYILPVLCGKSLCSCIIPWYGCQEQLIQIFLQEISNLYN